MLNVVCVNWGLKFKPIYTQNLYNMVKRHLTVPFKFICYTNSMKLQKVVKAEDFEVRKLPFADEYTGYWNKLSLFSPEANLMGPCLYFDLDVVILDNIDCFANFGNAETFGVMRDFGQPQIFYNSSILRFNNSNATAGIWKPFLEKQSEFMRLQGDQNVITDLVDKKPLVKNVKIFDDTWTQSYKWLDRSQTRFHKNSWTFEQSERAKVAIFHGNPKPHESDQNWVKNNWK